MPARNTTITVGSAWVAISDGAISEITLMQNQGAHDVYVKFASSLPAADAAPDLIWPATAVETAFAVPNAPLTVYARAVFATQAIKIVHA